jgi:catechol 2,3-dioxygenase-like lactoylglutathione lyase family enzyme
MPIKSVAHLCLKTKNLQATLDFYGGALGLRKLFNFNRHGEVIGFYLKAANDTFIEVFQMHDAEVGTGRQLLHHFCLETDDIKKLWQTLSEKGYGPRELIMGADNALQFWVQDPNGLDIEIQQYTERSAQFTGEDVEVT